MKISEKIAQPIPAYSNKPNAAQLAFRGNPVGATKKIAEGLPVYIKLFSWLSKYNGEIPSILINAIGTGIFAPMVIYNNPLSKEDKDTKAYSAWRQPLSAVLAIITQVGVNIPTNMLITKLAQKGKLGEEFEIGQAGEKVKKLTEKGIEKLSKAKKAILAQAEKRIANIDAKQVERATNKIGSVRKLVGIGMSLLTLAPTCYILNWVYPRFMEKVFPDIANAKKAKGGK